MPYAKGTRFLQICTRCNNERWTRDKHPKSGLCRSCATSVSKQGSKLPRTFLPGALYHEEALRRFWSKVNKDASCPCHRMDDQCWVWTDYVNPDTGYGRFLYDGSLMSAHRFAYQAEHGLVPEGLLVLHRPPCVLKHCVRHLYVGTAKDNTADLISMQGFQRGENHWRNRHPEAVPRGSQCANAKLIEEQVRDVRRRFQAATKKYGLCSQFARELGVTPRVISLILRGEAWTHVTLEE